MSGRGDDNHKVLDVRGLCTRFFTSAGVARAVDEVALSLQRGKTLGLVGESGCGKSVTALSIMRLVPDPPGRITSGEILLDGQDLASLSEKRMREIRGREVAMIFQEPMTSLNPVFTIGNQLIEAIRVHEDLSKSQARRLALEMLERVGIPNPAERLSNYPHQLSGGQQQRVMIAMAISLNPRLLIADEPTTALDVTVQAQILKLLDELRREFSIGILFITHDMAVIAQTADDVAVMYAGRIVETADVFSLFKAPRHPYTRLLFESIPTEKARGSRLRTIKGTVPPLTHLPRGCNFQKRCPLAIERCIEEDPTLREIAGGHLSACHRAEEVEELMR